MVYPSLWRQSSHGYDSWHPRGRAQDTQGQLPGSEQSPWDQPQERPRFVPDSLVRHSIYARTFLNVLFSPSLFFREAGHSA